MLHTTELLRRVLVPLLATGAVLLGVLFAYLVIQRILRELKWKRRLALIARYQPVIDEIVQSGPTPRALAHLRTAPVSHRRIISDLLLAPLHAARGDLVSHVRAAAGAIDLIAQWHAQALDRRWWVRADGLRALGFVEEPSALPVLMSALGDEHPEVRAAAVETAGRLRDPRAIPALLATLVDSAHYHSVRVIDALRTLGPTVTPALVALAQARPDQTRMVADVLGLIGTAAATEPLLRWCGDPRSEVRAAAIGALGSIGLDDRSHYFALKALGDSDPQTRAMAARALGREGRQDAVSYLAARLDDDWLPAAHAAAALRHLGDAGLAALRGRARDAGQAGDLARQMLESPPSIEARA